MLGKTNLLFVAEDEAAELAFKPEYILTSSSGSILKIEYINNLFFAFTGNRVLYGSDINNLQILKKDGNPFPATYVIYKNNAYYMVIQEENTQKAVVYKTTNLTTFEEITIRTAESETKTTAYTLSFRTAAILLTSGNRIAILYSKEEGGYNYESRFLLIDSLDNFNHEENTFISYSKKIGTNCNDTKIQKDRIFSTGLLITLDGYMRTVDGYQYFALDYFFKKTHYVSDSLYYSLNGVDYIHIPFDKQINILNTFEHDGSIAMIYTYEEGDRAVQHFTTAATPKDLANAINSSIPVSIDYTMQQDASLYKDGYSYLGCSGGIIIKGQIDNAEVIRPDVVVVKGMAAKEALRQANDYTDEKYKNTTKEVKEIEETTRQYMENAFSATPEGYAELVDTVHGNTVAINAIVEKAELNIKETAMGDKIHLIDSADGKNVEFALYGKVVQNTTSGKNLLPYPYYNNGVTSNGVTFTNNSDGSIKIVGKNSSNGSIRYRLADYVGSFTLNAGEYIVSLGGIVKNSITLMVELYDKGIYKKSYGIIRETEVSFSITQDDLNDCEEPVIYVYIDVLANADIDTTVYPMIRFASITDDTYEPYTGGIPAPNPDYPQDIDISGNSGNVKIVSCGKNLLKNTATATHKNGIDLTVNDDKSITLNGTAIIDTIITNLNEDMGLKEGEYILSGSSNVVHMFVDRFTSDNKFDKEWLDRSKDFVKFPVTAEDLALGKIFKTRAVISKDTVVNNETIYPMICLASDTDDTYQPYKETTAIIQTLSGIAGIKVDSGGNYTDQSGQQWICDEIVKYADGSGKRIQRIGKAVFDGSEDEAWNKDSKGRWYSRTLSPNAALGSSDSDSKKIPNALCNSYQPRKGGQTYEQIMGIALQNNTFIVYDPTYGESDKTAWTTYLSSNPVTVYYEIASPICTPLTSEQIAEIEKLSTFYPMTNISNDSDCGMRITYLVDSKNYINRKVAEQVASIVENIK